MEVDEEDDDTALLQDAAAAGQLLGGDIFQSASRPKGELLLSCYRAAGSSSMHLAIWPTFTDLVTAAGAAGGPGTGLTSNGGARNAHEIREAGADFDDEAFNRRAMDARGASFAYRMRC